MNMLTDHDGSPVCPECASHGEGLGLDLKRWRGDRNAECWCCVQMEQEQAARVEEYERDQALALGPR